MSSAWRQFGLNYINYSQICARAVRQCLKTEFRTAAEPRNSTLVKTTKWVDGKPGKPILPGQSLSSAKS